MNDMDKIGNHAVSVIRNAIIWKKGNEILMIMPMQMCIGQDDLYSTEKGSDCGIVFYYDDGMVHVIDNRNEDHRMEWRYHPSLIGIKIEKNPAAHDYEKLTRQDAEGYLCSDLVEERERREKERKDEEPEKTVQLHQCKCARCGRIADDDNCLFYNKKNFSRAFCFNCVELLMGEYLKNNR